MTMILVEKHDYKINSKHYKELDNVCLASKNLYNCTLYHIRQHYFETGEFLGFCRINKMSNELFPEEYSALPRKVSQQVQKLVDQNFRSFFNHLKARKQGKCIHIPNYLQKDGRQVVHYTKQAISFNNRNVPSGYVKLSGISFLIKTKVSDIEFVRIVPKHNRITVEIGYRVNEQSRKYGDRYAAIDLGVNNLATMTSNVFSPIIINGKPLKSVNQYYNKRIAEESSKHRTWTKRMYSILNIRNNRINDYMHKASRYIVNQLVENRINTLVIGYNKGWKQDINTGKRNNQKFVQIPFLTFIRMLEYKCSLVGIEVIVHEESYTSKASFYDDDAIPTYNNAPENIEFSGKRINRGLYRNKDGSTINADVNGSMNILRKTLLEKEVWNETMFSDCIEVCSVPSVYTVKR